MNIKEQIEKQVISVEKIGYDQVPQLSKRDIAYIQEINDLRPFYKYSPTLQNFQQVITDKQKDETNRELLVDVLENQYANLDTKNQVGKNIESLRSDSTFTIVTAHQPSLFFGPLYYVLKILSTVNLAEQLKKAYPKFNFVPIFVTGGEDHDFEEVQKTQIFGKPIVWENEENGSVGAMKTDKIPLEELKALLGASPNAQKVFSIIEKAHTQNSTYSDAVIEMIHSLFGKYGLVVLNMNQPKLKSAFSPIIEDELLNQTSHRFVSKSIKELESKGLSAQASPREINLFYLKDQMRERIVFEDSLFKVLNTDIKFSEREIKEEVKNHPERFSPNVILRPLYQEKILPNLAYIGGGGEIAYWLERKTQFEHYGINFPMLIRRNSALWLDKNSHKKLDKLDYQIGDFFADEHSIINSFVKTNTDAEVSLKAEMEKLEALFQSIEKKATAVDKSLLNYIEAEKTKQQKTFSNIESKLLRAEKQHHENGINQIKKIKEKIFPGNGLQERKENFLSIYLKHGHEMFALMSQHLDPLDKRFTIFKENF